MRFIFMSRWASAICRASSRLICGRMCLWRCRSLLWSRSAVADSGVEFGLELLEDCVGPGVRGLSPGVALFAEEVGEVHPAVSGALFEVEEGLRGSVEVEDGLEAVAGPLDGGEALSFRLLERADVVDEHGVENALFVRGLGAVAGVEVTCGALVLEDYGPGDLRRVGGEERATGGERERLHISHDTIERGVGGYGLMHSYRSVRDKVRV